MSENRRLVSPKPYTPGLIESVGGVPMGEIAAPLESTPQEYPAYNHAMIPHRQNCHGYDKYQNQWQQELRHFILPAAPIVAHS